MPLARILLACSLFLACAATVSAEIYRWVDSGGVVHFTDAPPPSGVDAHVVRLSADSTGLDGGPGSAATVVSSGKVAQAQAQKEHRVQLYVTSWCPWCKKAIEFFRSRGIRVTIYDVEQDSEAARRKDQLDSRGGVPFAMIDGKPVHGYSEAAYLKALGLDK